MLRWEAGPQGASSLILLPPSACPPPPPGSTCHSLYHSVAHSLPFSVSLCLFPLPTSHLPISHHTQLPGSAHLCD